MLLWAPRSYAGSSKFALIFEYMSGGTVEDVIRSTTPHNPPLYWHTMVSWMEQTIKAVCWMHEKNIAHRDLKTANMLLDHKDRGRKQHLNLDLL